VHISLNWKKSRIRSETPGVRYKQSAIAFDVMCTSALENKARESQQTAFVC
jgi:hypothetical protein